MKQSTSKNLSENKKDIDYIFENIIGGGGIWQWLVILLIWPIGISDEVGSRLGSGRVLVTIFRFLSCNHHWVTLWFSSFASMNVLNVRYRVRF